MGPLAGALCPCADQMIPPQQRFNACFDPGSPRHQDRRGRFERAGVRCRTPVSHNPCPQDTDFEHPYTSFGHLSRKGSISRRM